MNLLNSCRLILSLSLFLLLVQSCKKELPVNPEQSERSEAQLVKDSVYYYYQLYSLWSDSGIPDSQDVIAFTANYDSAKDVLDALKRSTPFYAGYQTNIDRFTFMENSNVTDSQITDEVNQNRGFGIFASIGAVNTQTAYPVIYFVTGGSPAALAGIKRSDIILGVDEFQDCSIPVSCTSSGCQVLDQKIQQAVTNRLLGAMQQNSMQLRLRHADDTESTVTLNASAFEIDPVIKNKVFVYPSKSVGYLALSSFEDVSAEKKARQSIDHVFTGFEQNQISDLIIDLRYNNGGHVKTVEYLANKVAGTAADQALMFKYITNDYLSNQPDFRDKEFGNVYFKLDNKLKINTVYFLVTDITASASELLINVLKPYMNVMLIAEHKSTYGKPVGFFKQQIMGNTGLWVASFKLSNSRGETDYWDGIEADQQNVADYIFSDFGDLEETMLSAALQHSVGNLNASRTAVRRDRTTVDPKIKMNNINTISQSIMLQ